MEKHIEIEYKMFLSKKQYQTILEDIKDKAMLIKQVNIYFDSDKQPLFNKNQSLRCRVINDKAFELTLKEKRENDNLEHNYILSKVQFNQLKHMPLLIIKTYINDIPEDIRIIGQLENTRYEWEDNGVYALDCSKYFNTIDYEIEYEAIDYDQKDNLANFLGKYKIDFIENKTTKIQRFKEALAKLGKNND